MLVKKLFSFISLGYVFSKAIVIEGVAGVGARISLLNHDLVLLLCGTSKQRFVCCFVQSQEIHKQRFYSSRTKESQYIIIHIRSDKSLITVL
jgi:hypothetical protein